jgi:hypothetical protein
LRPRSSRTTNSSAGGASGSIGSSSAAPVANGSSRGLLKTWKKRWGW